MVILAWSFVFPFLLVMLILQGAARLMGRDVRGLSPTLALGLASLFLTLVPVGGLSLGRWLISFNANFSIPLTVLIFSKVTETASGLRLLDKQALPACWLFSLIAGAALYPMALGIGPYDPYAAGWGFSWLFVAVCTVTVLLFVVRNRFAVVLAASILAHDLHLLESANFWDYLVDPFMVLVSCLALGNLFLHRWGNRHSA